MQSAASLDERMGRNRPQSLHIGLIAMRVRPRIRYGPLADSWSAQQTTHLFDHLNRGNPRL